MSHALGLYTFTDFSQFCEKALLLFPFKNETFYFRIVLYLQNYGKDDTQSSCILLTLFPVL